MKMKPTQVAEDMLRLDAINKELDALIKKGITKEDYEVVERLESEAKQIVKRSEDAIGLPDKNKYPLRYILKRNWIKYRGQWRTLLVKLVVFCIQFIALVAMLKYVYIVGEIIWNILP